MPARSHLVLIAIGALLVLILGVGGALLLRSGASIEGEKQAQTDTLVLAQPSATAFAVDENTPTVLIGEALPTEVLTATQPVQVPATSTALPKPPAPPAPTETNTAIVATNTPVLVLAATPTKAKAQAARLKSEPSPSPLPAGGRVSVPNDHPGPRWVTLQAGHWHNENLPPEQQHLADHTGAYAAGVSEVEINIAVAVMSAHMLYDRGYSVEVLDAAVPPGYTTDLFLALHADGNAVTSMRGFKAVAPWGSVPASDQFVGILYEEYGKASGLPSDAMTSPAMANYYAFNPVKYQYAVDPRVPSALLEMGFVTNPADRRIMTTEQERLAQGIANAVDRYFRSGAAGPTPSPYPTYSPTRTPTGTATSTSTSTPTFTGTPTETFTPLPPETALAVTETAAVTTPATATRTPKPPTATKTPTATETPVVGVVTADGRWLPPVAPDGKRLPPAGSKAQRVLISQSDDTLGDGFAPLVPGWQAHVWLQYYVPSLGRSVWVEGDMVTPTPTSTATMSPTVTGTATTIPTMTLTPTPTKAGP